MKKTKSLIMGALTTLGLSILPGDSLSENYSNSRLEQNILSNNSTNQYENNLEELMEEDIRAKREKWQIQSDVSTGWLVYDLEKREELASININSKKQCASMCKPYILLAYFTCVEGGLVSYDEVSKKQVELMIQKSSNSSTNWIIDQLGSADMVNKILHIYYEQIFQNTDIVEKIPAGGKTYKNKTTPQDAMLFLEALYDDKLPYSNEIKRVMGLRNGDALVKGVEGIPQNTEIIDKTGSTSHAVCNMGIIYAKDKEDKTHPYIIVGMLEKSILADNFKTWRENSMIILRDEAKLAYQQMDLRYHLSGVHNEQDDNSETGTTLVVKNSKEESIKKQIKTVSYIDYEHLPFEKVSTNKILLDEETKIYLEREMYSSKQLESLVFNETNSLGYSKSRIESLSPKQLIDLSIQVVINRLDYIDDYDEWKNKYDHLSVDDCFIEGKANSSYQYVDLTISTFNTLKKINKNPKLNNIYLQNNLDLSNDIFDYLSIILPIDDSYYVTNINPINIEKNESIWTMLDQNEINYFEYRFFGGIGNEEYAIQLIDQLVPTIDNKIELSRVFMDKSYLLNYLDEYEQSANFAIKASDLRGDLSSYAYASEGYINANTPNKVYLLIEKAKNSELEEDYYYPYLLTKGIEASKIDGNYFKEKLYTEELLKNYADSYFAKNLNS